jgi:hypothetical protein
VRQIPSSLATSLALIAATVAIGGCGRSDNAEGERLPSATADELRRQLTSVSERVASRNAGACGDIFEPPPTGNIEPIDAAMTSIPDDVDPDIRAALEQSIDHLKELVDAECEAILAVDEREREEQPPPQVTPEPTEEPVDPESEKPEKEKDEEKEEKDEEKQQEQDGQEEEAPDQGPDGEGPPGQIGGGADVPTDEQGE